MNKHAWLVFIPLCLAGCAKEQPYVKPLTPVRIQPVATETAADGPKYSGSVEPIGRVDMAFRLGGYVEELLMVPAEGGGMRPVHEGDTVTKGTTMVKLRPTDYKVKVDQASSQVDQAKAALVQTQQGVRQAQVGVDKAKLDYDRADALYKKQSLTKMDMDNAKAQLDNANAVLDGAKAQLPLAQARIAGAQGLVDEANLALKDSSLVAPITGVVLKRLVEVGSLVGPGTPAFVVADLDTLKAVFGAPDVLLSHLKQGEGLTITAEAAAAPFTGRITAVASAADARSRVFDVEVTFKNPGMRLKPGMIVSIEMPGKAASAAVPVVPLAAIVRPKSSTNGYAVFVVDTQGGKSVAKARNVTLGAALNDSVIVTSGLNPGENVIVSGSTLVNDGDTVQIVP